MIQSFTEGFFIMNTTIGGILDITNSFFELIYPPTCAGCGTSIYGQKNPICSNCMHHLRMISNPICPLCGAPLSADHDPKSHKCRFCPPGKLYFNKVRSVYSYKDKTIKNLIQSLKFNHQRNLSPPLSRLLYLGFKKYYDKDVNKIDALIPVPLHKSRLREREFNQSLLLSREIVLRTNIPLRNDLAQRIRPTPAQSSLDTKKRMKNLANAFAITPNSSVEGLTVLIIDDVMTTGATINTLSKAFKDKGAAKIFALTLALTIDIPSNR